VDRHREAERLEDPYKMETLKRSERRKRRQNQEYFLYVTAYLSDPKVFIDVF
jgi:hypothetical protein